jgi:signal transduction histidine kinase
MLAKGETKGEKGRELSAPVDGAGSGLDFLGLRSPDSSGPPADSRASRRPVRSGPAQILLVEDDASIRDALRGVLESEGYSVATAENGRQALEALKANEAPALIILDLRMPIMDGWQFRAAQKSDPLLADIPVLAISADGSAKAAAIDAAAYLRKPLSTETLLGTIRKILVEEERQRMFRRLEEAERFAALGRLAASVGHEINNPLAYVSMNLDIAIAELTRFLQAPVHNEGGLEDLQALPTMFRECRIGLDRIRDVVKDLQRLSRRSEVKRESFSMNDLIEESLAMAQNHVRHRATVEKRYGELPPVVGDRSAIGQVLLNLILNAAQSLPEGRADLNSIALTTRLAERQIVVEVRDTGPGIAADVLPHIFDPFFTTKPIGEGTGLGLAVSYRIMADHGGHIEVDSQPGCGALFRILLPLTDRMELAPFPRQAPQPIAPSSTVLRVLVIDDMAAIGRTIAAALPEHHVTVVAHAREAFEQLSKNEAFDVILCDLLMPELGGRDVLERLKLEWPHLARSVIFMTGGAFTVESREFMEHVPQRVLTKPFSIDELRAAVTSLIEERDQERN